MKAIQNTTSRMKLIGVQLLEKRKIFSLVLVSMFLLNNQSFAQGVGISESSIAPDASSILELRSTLRGFLPPRLTTVERDAIGAPVTGLFLYNTTTNRFNYRNGSWLALVSATDNLSVFASTTSAQLLGVLSDETGSDAAVFANTPTLVTPVLGAATGTSRALGGGTALTITNQTGTGNLVLATSPTITGANLAAGTATVDPLTFTSGTNLTTAAAGSVEYDGTSFYATSVASTRQVVRTEQFISNTANFTMANVNTAQSVFAAANDVFTLPAATTYFFEGVYNITGMGATTRTTATLFGGTTTIISIAYYAMIQTGAANALGAAQTTKNNITAAANVLNATVATAAATITVKGIVRINAGGTFIPQIQFSANPTGAIIGTTNSWFRMYPVGTNTAAAVGNVN